MKRFYKISLITAAIFALIGAMSICIGWAMGGSIHDYNQIGIFYHDGELELYPEYREFEDREDRWEEKWDHLEEHLENHFGDL